MIAFLRRARDPNDSVVVVCNFTPVVRENYRVGVPSGGYYREILNTDSEIYGGSNVGNYGGAWGIPRAPRRPAVSLEPPPAALGRALLEDTAVFLTVAPILRSGPATCRAATDVRWRVLVTSVFTSRRRR